MQQHQHDTQHTLKDQDAEDQEVINEEEKIEEESWDKYISYLNRNNLGKRSQYFHDPLNKTKDPYPKRLLIQILIPETKLDQEQIPTVSFSPTLKKIFDIKRSMAKSEAKNLPDAQKVQLQKSVLPKKEEYENHIKSIKTCLLAFLRDIGELTWEIREQEELIRLTINMLRLIEESIYIFEDEHYLQLALMIFNQLTIKDDTFSLLLNSLPLQELLIESISFYFLEANQYSQIAEYSLLLLVQLVTYYEYTNQTRINMDLVKLLVACYKKLNEVIIQAKQINEKQQEKEEEKKQGKKKLALDEGAEQEFNLDEKVIQVPLPMQEFLALAMATLPDNICDMKVNDKFHLVFRNNRIDNIFNQILSTKVLQSITSDASQRYDEDFYFEEILQVILTFSRAHEYFAVSRETIRAFINMLHCFDGMILWFKFDSYNLFIDNSNYLRMQFRGQVQVKIHGSPFKVPIDSGLYYDGCGADFRLGEGLEIIGETPCYDVQNYHKDGLQLPSKITICFWMVYYSQITQRKRKIETKHKVKTLLGCNDGVTSLIFFDPNMVLLGITNIGKKVIKDKEEKIEMQDIGLKFFDTNFEKSKRIFQGWNHITVILNNDECKATLFLNGQWEDEIEGVYHQMNVKYICNHKGMEQPAGYICDLRVYPKVLTDEEVRTIGHYQKQIKMLNALDIIEVLYERKIMAELRKLIIETQGSNLETCYVILECISLLCFASTKMRLEAAKQNIFELASSLIYNKNPMISYQANQVILSMM